MVRFDLLLAWLGLVAVERLVELAIARKNARWSFAHGGIEVGRGHYPAMVALHASVFAIIPLEVVLAPRPFRPSLALACATVLASTIALRAWVIRVLGPRWNTRVIVVPGLPPILGGPFRWIRHPNYVAVVLEMIALPLFHGAWLSALFLSIGNALILRARVRCEEQALSTHAAAPEAYLGRPRFLPRSP